MIVAEKRDRAFLQKNGKRASESVVLNLNIISQVGNNVQIFGNRGGFEYMDVEGKSRDELVGDLVIASGSKATSLSAKLQ